MPYSERNLVLVNRRQDIRSNYSVDFYSLPEDDFNPASVENDKVKLGSFVEKCRPISEHPSFPNNSHLRHIRQSIPFQGRVYFLSSKSPFSYVRNVNCWDAIHHIWTSPPPRMNVARSNCSFHVLGGKLYVCSSSKQTKDCNQNVFMERLDYDEEGDSMVGKWTVLPFPPSEVKLDFSKFVSASVESKGYILFGSEACRYFYAYTPPNTWKCMERERERFHFNRCLFSTFTTLPSSPVVTEKYVLWVREGTYKHPLSIEGFDHNNGYTCISINLVLHDIFHDLNPRASPRLAYAGDDVLSLVWIDDNNLSSLPVCHCRMFSIYIGVDSTVRVKLVSRLARFAPKSMKTLIDAFYMYGEPSLRNPIISHAMEEEEENSSCC